MTHSEYLEIEESRQMSNWNRVDQVGYHPLPKVDSKAGEVFIVDAIYFDDPAVSLVASAIVNVCTQGGLWRAMAWDKVLEAIDLMSLIGQVTDDQIDAALDYLIYTLEWVGIKELRGKLVVKPLPAFSAIVLSGRVETLIRV